MGLIAEVTAVVVAVTQPSECDADVPIGAECSVLVLIALARAPGLVFRLRAVGDAVATLLHRYACAGDLDRDIDNV